MNKNKQTNKHRPTLDYEEKYNALRFIYDYWDVE